MSPAETPPRRTDADRPLCLIRKKVVLARTGHSETTLYTLMAEGKFPRPVKISARCIAWDERLVEDYIRKLLEASHSTAGRSPARQGKPTAGNPLATLPRASSPSCRSRSAPTSRSPRRGGHERRLSLHRQRPPAVDIVGRTSPRAQRHRGVPGPRLPVGPTTDKRGDATASASRKEWRQGGVQLVRFTLAPEDFETWPVMQQRYPQWTHEHVARLEDTARPPGRLAELLALPHASVAERAVAADRNEDLCRRMETTRRGCSRGALGGGVSADVYPAQIVGDAMTQQQLRETRETSAIGAGVPLHAIRPLCDVATQETRNGRSVGRARADDAQGSLESEMNMTVDRLRRLKPGDVAIYYRGHLGPDIEHSADVPQYREILKEIADTACTLEQQGLVKLSERSAIIEFEATLRDGRRITHRIPITEYVAVGR
jgi:prophage regulatory protein